MVHQKHPGKTVEKKVEMAKNTAGELRENKLQII